MKPVELPCEPPFNPELAVIDSHVHMWSTPKYDYFTPDYLKDAETSGHKILATVYAECGFGHATDGPEELRAVPETAHALQQARLAEGSSINVNAGILAASNLQLGERLREVMDAHIEAGGGRLRGIRWRAAYHPDKSLGYEESIYPDREVMEDEAVIEGARVLADCGLTLGVLLLHPQLDTLASLARKVPDLTIAINHTGSPLGIGSYAGRQDDTFREWSAAIRRIGELPNLNIQIGGIGSTRVGYAPHGELGFAPANKLVSSDQIAERWQDWVDVCMEGFGADRVVFESNFSVDRALAAYGTYINGYKKMLAGYSEDEQRKVFSENAKRVFRIE